MKRTRLKRKRPLKAKSPKRALTDALDCLLRQVVVLRDRDCVACKAGAKPGRGGGLEVAHILPKGQWPNLRYNLANVRLLCHRCHFHRAHKDPFFWFNVVGHAHMQELRFRARTLKKPDRKLEKIMLEQEIERYMGGKA